MRVKNSEYIQYLNSKGFRLGEDAIGFILFGKHYTGAEDELVNAAIEITLKAQFQFDGSFYMSLLEALLSHKCKQRHEAITYAKQKGILA
ncbi:hypothetical protein EJF36_10755 [Bacillus sp. HMF5848]|uniref:DUF6123 family protein n=1 Tax=Bacillus sp. HMF5848 TaxID=2495421 RepID=UPI000F7928BF|nr:DUF6123 family protein [Bacillus sp. HMF5848]RSK27325.1 hypothetical protein EJF36_10755 [Bacillus sp. HMF5848]